MFVFTGTQVKSVSSDLSCGEFIWHSTSWKQTTWEVSLQFSLLQICLFHLPKHTVSRQLQVQQSFWNDISAMLVCLTIQVDIQSTEKNNMSQYLMWSSLYWSNEFELGVKSAKWDQIESNPFSVWPILRNMISSDHLICLYSYDFKSILCPLLRYC